MPVADMQNATHITAHNDHDDTFDFVVSSAGLIILCSFKAAEAPIPILISAKTLGAICKAAELYGIPIEEPPVGESLALSDYDAMRKATSEAYAAERSKSDELRQAADAAQKAGSGVRVTYYGDGRIERAIAPAKPTPLHSVHCSHCGARTSVDDDERGGRPLPCADCGRTLRVPIVSVSSPEQYLAGTSLPRKCPECLTWYHMTAQHPSTYSCPMCGNRP